MCHVSVECYHFIYLYKSLKYCHNCEEIVYMIGVDGFLNASSEIEA